MAEFSYRAHSVDGSRNAESGVVTAADKREAESKVKAKYSYPVRVVWLDDVIPQLARSSSSGGSWSEDSFQIMESDDSETDDWSEDSTNGSRN
ncbi:hypothetical protein B8W70_02205 [Pseudomonas sp. 1239]|uniref:hypothetical protein n=1 Tax=Pseudomonas TaxID=286 RepID=UPI0005C250FE|nr:MULTISPECIES: hypothetical protein [Pseudomonas]KIU52280.1 hypothetical protein QV12_09325 [Pseudomonas putida]OUM35498.1 hypothetical protein B8W70_02205 [Pseudomonas sp. 1239]WKL66514.1 hypothetical protein Q1Z72_25035 [Pseudomonas qingdaonensis]